MSRENERDGRGADGGEPAADLRRVLEHLDRPAARPEFRAALRERFLADAVESAQPGAIRTTPVVEFRDPAERPHAPRRLILLAGALAAAAAIVLTLFLTRTRTSLWRVHPDSTATSVRVDGIALSLDDPARLVEALVSAREIEVVGGTLRAAVRDEAWIELTAGTRLTQVKFAAAGPYQVCIERGALAVATLPAFRGNGLRVLSADFDLQVTGTIFGVDVDATGSCVCTLEGSVRCDAQDGNGPKPVETGRMCFAYRDRRAPAWGVAHEEHLEPLRALRASLAVR